MRDFLFLPLIAVAVVLSLMCGATLEASQMYQTDQAVSADLEIPGIAPAVAQVVHDPGSCGDSSTDADQMQSLIANCRPARNILRQGVRLLCFLRGSC
jgi:hypothetical protein